LIASSFGAAAAAAVAVAKRRFLFAPRRRDFYQLATHPWHDARAVP